MRSPSRVTNSVRPRASARSTCVAVVALEPVHARWRARAGCPLGHRERRRRRRPGARAAPGRSRPARADAAARDSALRDQFVGARVAGGSGCTAHRASGPTVCRGWRRSASSEPAVRRCFSSSSGRASSRSSGSACAAGSDEPSHVLVAVGFEPEVAQTAVRFTMGAGHHRRRSCTRRLQPWFRPFGAVQGIAQPH